MRLIDADIYPEFIKESIHRAILPSELTEIALRRVLQDLKDIKITPTVEAVPVVHGKWIDEGEYNYIETKHGFMPVRQCSVCGCDITINNYDKYCPNCGARMDGKE